MAIDDHGDFFTEHPSGVGYYISPPVGMHYRIWRTPGPQEVTYPLDARGNAALDDEDQPLPPTVRDLPLLYGYSDVGRRFLDWDAPVDQDVTYWVETGPTPEGPWKTIHRIKLRCAPEMTYSVLSDSGIQDVMNIRDALVVFLSVRLAQEARAGRVYTRQLGHRKRFNVVTEYEFAEADLPAVSVGYSYGTGAGADLGVTMMEEIVKIHFEVLCADKRERDSLTSAFRGLLPQIELFLGDLGCIDTTYGELQEVEQGSDPMYYRLSLSISTVLLTQVGYRPAHVWELAPIGGWTGEVYGNDDLGLLA